MALDTFANLKQALINHSGHDELSSDVLEDFIQMAESQMFNNSSQPLRLRLMERRAVEDTNGTRFLALPEGFLQMRRLLINVSNSKPSLEQRATTSLVIRPSVDTPSAFAVTSQLEFDVVPDDTYQLEMQYYVQPPRLSSTVPTNDILTYYPHIYLRGALVQLFLYTGEEEIAQVHRGLFFDAIRGANEADKLGRYGAAPVATVEGGAI